MAKAKTKSQLQNEINSLQSQLCHARDLLKSSQNAHGSVMSSITQMQQDMQRTVEQRDDAVARADGCQKANFLQYKQLNELRSENQLNLDAMAKATGIINEGAERITTLKAELTAMERALAIISGVRATG